MNAFNRISSAIFDLVLDLPPGDEHAWFDMLVWPILGGIVALIVYKYTSNQAGITRTKGRIKMHLLEIRLFNHDLRVVLGATGRILAHNAVYIGLNMVPMVVMIVPIMAMLVQLEARYAFDPLPVGQEEILELRLDPEHNSAAITDLRLELPAGVELSAPPVRTPEGQVYWRIRALAAGDHVLKVHLGDAEVVEKGLAVGGAARKVPVKRTKSWEGFLYPGEAGLPSGSGVYSVQLRYPERELAWMPDGELGILLFFFAVSLISGYALKDVFGVVL